MSIEMTKVYAPSDDIVAREIEGELIIIPLVAGIGDLEDELFTLNETGKAIWDLLDGKKSLEEVTVTLAGTYDSPEGDLKEDVCGLVEELVKRKMLVEVTPIG